MGIDVWMACAELSPLARTGGLGEVLRSLPEALAPTGTRVRRFLPGYGCIDRSGFRPETDAIEIPVGKVRLTARFRSRDDGDGVTTTLVENEELFGGRKEVYGPPGEEFPDNPRRFAFFCRAIVELAARASRTPEVLHSHDWPAALVPLFVKFQKWNGVRPGTVFSIHNLAYQGRYGSWHIPWLGLTEEQQREVFHPAGIEYYGDVSFLKAGLLYSDRLVTVSPTYAKEILTPEFGHGLDGVLRERAAALTGILNGVDEKVWNPSTDRLLPLPYDPSNVGEGKRKAKEVLRKEFGMAPSDRPILASVGRFAHQKGVDVLLESAIPILDEGFDLAIVGDGDAEMAEKVAELRKERPERIGLFVGYDDRKAHLTMAAVDLVVVPSRYEPCGLAQLYGQRYGAVPVVHRTGGLADTVVDVDENPSEGTGFVFSPLGYWKLNEAVSRASAIYHDDPKRWGEIRARGMRKSFSWADSARAYLKIYREIAAIQAAIQGTPLPNHRQVGYS